MPVHTFTAGASARRRLLIGEWWADPATDELGRGSATVRIEPKAMEVLMVLAERPGQVVGREAFFAAVWPGVVVGDEALTQCIIKLRRALGDNPRAPTYIETLSKRGYRLIAPVREDEGLPATCGGSAVGLPQQRPDWLRRRWPIAAVASALLIAVASVVHSLLQTAPDADLVTEERQPAPLTVSVLPFESLGAQEPTYLARGISNDLATELSRRSDLRLISATSASPANPPNRSARYLVSGSVQRADETLRVNVHLIDAETSQQIWSERFERPFDDLFAVQDEIVHRLTDLLPAKVGDAARQRLAKRHTQSLEAYDAFLRAQALLLVRQPEENEAARALYRKAVELDPRFARAYAGLAMTYAMDHRLRPSDEAALARALELAETARLIDPDLPEIHWALALVHVQARRHEEALQSLRRAIELNRSFADAYALMGGIHTYAGEPAKAVPLVRTAMRLNPGGSYLYFQILGRAYLFANDNEQALINLREAHARNPVDLETRVYLAAALMAAGERLAAEWIVEEIRSREPAFSLGKWLASYPLSSARHRDRLVQLLAPLGL